MSENIDQTLGIENKGESPTDLGSQPYQTETHFKTLLGYGKFISGLGWIILIIGGLLFLFSISELSDTFGSTEALFSLGGVLIGLWLAISGIAMVIYGQTVSCFVAIEKNTRATHELIRAQIDGTQSAMTHVSDQNQSDEDDDISRDNLFK